MNTRAASKLSRNAMRRVSLVIWVLFLHFALHTAHGGDNAYDHLIKSFDENLQNVQPMLSDASPLGHTAKGLLKSFVEQHAQLTKNLSDLKDHPFISQLLTLEMCTNAFRFFQTTFEQFCRSITANPTDEIVISAMDAFRKDIPDDSDVMKVFHVLTEESYAKVLILIVDHIVSTVSKVPGALETHREFLSRCKRMRFELELLMSFANEKELNADIERIIDLSSFVMYFSQNFSIDETSSAVPFFDNLLELFTMPVSSFVRAAFRQDKVWNQGCDRALTTLKTETSALQALLTWHPELGTDAKKALGVLISEFSAHQLGIMAIPKSELSKALLRSSWILLPLLLYIESVKQMMQSLSDDVSDRTISDAVRVFENKRKQMGTLSDWLDSLLAQDFVAVLQGIAIFAKEYLNACTTPDPAAEATLVIDVKKVSDLSDQLIKELQFLSELDVSAVLNADIESSIDVKSLSETVNTIVVSSDEPQESRPVDPSVLPPLLTFIQSTLTFLHSEETNKKVRANILARVFDKLRTTISELRDLLSGSTVLDADTKESLEALVTQNEELLTDAKAVQQNVFTSEMLNVHLLLRGLEQYSEVFEQLCQKLKANFTADTAQQELKQFNEMFLRIDPLVDSVRQLRKGNLSFSFWLLLQMIEQLIEPQVATEEGLSKTPLQEKFAILLTNIRTVTPKLDALADGALTDEVRDNLRDKIKLSSVVQLMNTYFGGIKEGKLDESFFDQAQSLLVVPLLDILADFNIPSDYITVDEAQREISESMRLGKKGYRYIITGSALLITGFILLISGILLIRYAIEYEKNLLPVLTGGKPTWPSLSESQEL